jgi:asparagine synthase (glutamine-hydrolysing)
MRSSQRAKRTLRDVYSVEATVGRKARMCGIAGVLGGPSRAALLIDLARMTGAVVHRGPDSAGVWLDESAGLALGHRRLAIVDLTDTGAQPMVSACGRYAITYNGELYNTEELRAELAAKGDVFRGHSDTEVLLAGLARWGLEVTLKKLVGIFAFGFWDRENRCLSLARDHLGVKPLYWSQGPNGFAFASELRALAALPWFDRALDMAGIGAFLQAKYIRAPLTIYRAASALPPGCHMSVRAEGPSAPKAYWRLEEVASRLAGQRAAAANAAEALESLEAILRNAVRRQMVSDVPLGAFLSGGIDSSTVVAMMQRASSRPVRTFSIGFDRPGFDEAPAAKAVAAHLKTDHTEHYVTDKDALELAPRMAGLFDQPHADVSNIATYLLCKMARAHVTVALSGDGGDELFFGYSRYLHAARVRRHVARLPGRVRGLLAAAIGGRALRNEGFAWPGRVARARWSAARLLHLARDDAGDVYRHFGTAWLDPGVMAPGAQADDAGWAERRSLLADPDERMMLHDSLTYLPDDVLAKVDRASMAVSLEARVPLLDHRVVEHAWGMSQSLKYQGGVGKWALKQVLYRYVPPALVDRPKQGFDAPIGSWLRGGLRDWGETLLSPAVIKRFGVLDPRPVQQLWKAHQSGTVDASPYLWCLLNLQSWLQDGHPAPATQAPLLEPTE